MERVQRKVMLMNGQIEFDFSELSSHDLHVLKEYHSNILREIKKFEVSTTISHILTTTKYKKFKENSFQTKSNDGEIISFKIEKAIWTSDKQNFMFCEFN
jgi:hypothetical protein